MRMSTIRTVTLNISSRASRAAVRRAGQEHGHFHTFLRAEGMPVGVAPLLLRNRRKLQALRRRELSPSGAGIREEVSHLPWRLSSTARASRFRLFTTNRWVTGETTGIRPVMSSACSDRFASH